MKIEADQTIALACLNDKTYIIPLWIEVPNDTALSDIKVTRPPRADSAPTVLAEQFVTGSTGNEYLVRIWSDGRGECECWGYRRHKKDCKHIRAARTTGA